jgi:hypothetical protein
MLADAVYGPLPGGAAQGVRPVDPSTVPDATRATNQPARPMDGEAGFNAKSYAPSALMANPVTWLIVSIAGAIAAARYAAAGSIL